MCSCAAQVGDIRGNIGMPSNVPEPSRPAGFPEVTLLWERTARDAGQPQAYASLSTPPAREPAVASDASSEETINLDDELHYESITGLGSAPSGDEPAVEPEENERPPEPAPEPTPAPVTPAPEPEPASPGRADAVLARLPAPDDASDSEAAFRGELERAIRRVYDEDFADPAVLLSLAEKLRTDPALATARDPLMPFVQEGILRARSLGKLGWSLRRLEAAFSNAALDPSYGLWRGIDMRECRLAFRRVMEADRKLMNIAVTVKPVGSRTLAELQQLCDDSHASELMERDFPAVVGPSKLKKQVRRLYAKRFPGSRVHQVSVPEGWKPKDGLKVLRAIVGVERKNAFPDDPCVMQEVLLHMTRGRPDCCDIESSVAIACDVIR